MTRTSTRPSHRLDLHNASTHFFTALEGRCGFTHLPSGRVCGKSHRHAGPCELALITSRSRPVRAEGNRS
jgi:hypothetical protein